MTNVRVIQTDKEFAMAWINRYLDGDVHPADHGALSEAVAAYRLTIETAARESAAKVWQPIETMPNDQWVLVYLPDEGSSGTIHAARRLKVSNGYLRQVGHQFASDLTPATHWQPAPNPPATAIRESSQ